MFDLDSNEEKVDLADYHVLQVVSGMSFSLGKAVPCPTHFALLYSNSM